MKNLNNKIIHLDVPNDKTVKAINEARSGKGLKPITNLITWLKKL